MDQKVVLGQGSCIELANFLINNSELEAFLIRLFFSPV